VFTVTLSLLSDLCFLPSRIGGGLVLLLSDVIYGKLLAGVIDVQFAMGNRGFGR
jgi:hypothetical protein